MELVKPRLTPPLDPHFRPAVLANRAFLRAVSSSGKSTPLVLGLERNEGSLSHYRTTIFAPGAPGFPFNLPYVERLVKMLLWQRGGYRLLVGGPREVGDKIKSLYGPGGARAFDADFMGRVYERPFTVEVTSADRIPSAREQPMPLGKHLNGCRIGFDAGASDRKVAAVIDGRTVFSEEVVWDPRPRSDPRYHFHEIMSALHRAAAHLPRIDAIGVSAAGIYINNRVMVASLFRGVPPDLFASRAKEIFLEIKRAWGGIPLEVINDGEVTALAGAMSLNQGRILGVAMGSSEAAGYVNQEEQITGWLNELAFCPVDYAPDAPIDEWSGDRGCGVQYFSQQAVIRLAPAAGITLPPKETMAERLKEVQGLMARGDERAIRLYETLGRYTGYGMAHYAEFYDLRHVLLLGRVTSGPGGALLLEKAREVIREEFPDLAPRIDLHLPDETNRRVGQAIAAASLPLVG